MYLQRKRRKKDDVRIFHLSSQLHYLDWIGWLPECSWASLGAHEDALRDVIQNLEEELCVGARLSRRFDLVWVQLAGLA